MAECSRNSGVNMPLAGLAIGLRRNHVDFDLTVIGRKSMFDARNDRHARARLAEMSRPGFVKGRIVLAVREIDLRVDHVLESRASQCERRHHPFGYDEFSFELDRL